ncbi:ribosomal protein S18 acetylase RimI-like enzyme [Lapillicoccus jejuensis]|uniref:Ribosomal protein S18 acetylase RimI-like enzyme n=2 Tax=Lapillicoccus jejuensis TaxID=402171 RepID=A0A542DVR0_9MICO|nr:ribosomal protein S18 acetylase RimI-like enzyme [Lapillicoccus jejuensis]
MTGENGAMVSLPLDPVPALPDGWSARVPTPEDLPALVTLGTARRTANRGSGSADPDAVTAEVLGRGSWTRRQAVAVDPAGRVRGWATVHDRAAGRTVVELTVDPDLPDPDADAVAAGLVPWLETVGLEYAAARGLAGTRLDALLDEGDERQRRWLEAAGYACTRTWLNMGRPVAAGEDPPGPRAGVVVRRVGVHELPDGTTLPVAEDLQAVHRVLEESFEDHWGSYRESFPEFAQRLREDPGHRWDHWWLALVEVDGAPMAGGALVSSVLPADAAGVEGTYLDYIGVHRRARGLGVAKALLHTMIRDAAERGRDRVALEVDADSPTAADGLYRSMGWQTRYVTQSWQRDTGHYRATR